MRKVHYGMERAFRAYWKSMSHFERQNLIYLADWITAERSATWTQISPID